MKAEYEEWINENVKEEDILGGCHHYSNLMVEKFPELKTVYGFYFDVSWGPREHRWVVTEEGEIIDPTKNQFPTKGRGVYEPMPDGYVYPTGKCINCGELIFDGNNVCDEKCHNEFANSLL